MKILAVGGGSGGHVTPVVAVCNQLRLREPDAEIRFWCDGKFFKQAVTSMGEADATIVVEKIMAGKLRRYNNLSLIRHVLQVRSIVLPNLIDAVKLSIGFIESLVKLVVWRPDVVFIKGGYVCLPVGIAAHLLRIPIVIHDSDAHPGLTNRIVGRFAKYIATGSPLKYYNYPKSRSKYVGIPVAGALSAVSHAEQSSLKAQLGFDEHEPLVVITGGGLGAQSMNDAALATWKDLTMFTSIILIAGRDNEAELRSHAPKSKKFRLVGYVQPSEMATMLQAADIAVTRAGATTLLELAALSKPSIIVPAEHLTGGHQIKNARVYLDAKAAVQLSERELKANPLSLVDTINATLLNKATMKSLSANIKRFAKPDAAEKVAEMILLAAKK